MTLTDIIGYLPHRLVGVSDNGDIMPIDIYALARRGIKLDGHKPVLRPMTDLITDITEKGYNDGKTFVPIAKLMEVATGLSGARAIGSIGVIQTEDTGWVYNYSIRWHPVLRTFTMSGYKNNKRMPLQGDRTHHTWNQYQLFDLLHRWHFDYRGLIEAGEAVDVHELANNPYE